MREVCRVAIQGGVVVMERVRLGTFDISIVDHDPLAPVDAFHTSIAFGQPNLPECIFNRELSEGLTWEMVDTPRSFLETVSGMTVFGVLELLEIDLPNLDG